MNNTERYLAKYPRFIALAIKGKDFLYKKEPAYAIRKGKSAQKLADALNGANYKTDGGRFVWTVYDSEYGTDLFALDECYFKKNGDIAVKQIEIW